MGETSQAVLAPVPERAVPVVGPVPADRLPVVGNSGPPPVALGRVEVPQVSADVVKRARRR